MWFSSSSSSIGGFFNLFLAFLNLFFSIYAFNLFLMLLFSFLLFKRNLFIYCLFESVHR